MAVNDGRRWLADSETLFAEAIFADLILSATKNLPGVKEMSEIKKCSLNIPCLFSSPVNFI
jgi:hypothetical protein